MMSEWKVWIYDRESECKETEIFRADSVTEAVQCGERCIRAWNLQGAQITRVELAEQSEYLDYAERLVNNVGMAHEMGGELKGEKGMIAKKCDICGVLYESYNTIKDDKNFNGFTFLNIQEDSQRYWSHGAIDCCPTCIAAIKDKVKELGGWEGEK